MNSKKKIKFLDLKKINKHPLQLSKNKIEKYLFSGNYILDKNVRNFEKKFANFNNAKFCVGVNSGHDALKLSLLCAGVKKNDQVIVPGNTFISTWFAVSEIGAKPLPIDINIEDGTIDVRKLPKKINKKIKGIIAVNLYGNLCDLKYLSKYCKKHKIFLIEDSAQSHGAHYKDEKIKLYGNYSCFSFYPGKNLGSVTDAGAIVTNSKSNFAKLKKMRNYGSMKKYYHDIVGTNSRMNILSSIFLMNKIKFLNSEIKTRKKQVQVYRKKIKWNKNLIPLKCHKSIIPAHHIFLIRTSLRKKLSKYLLKKNIETIMHYPLSPISQKSYIDLNNTFNNKLKNSILFTKTCLSLPLGSHLKEKDILYVSRNINNFFNLNNRA